MYNTILCGAITIILGMILEVMLRRKKILAARNGTKYVNDFHKWGHRSILLLCFILAFNLNDIFLVMIIIIPIVLSFSAFMEWKFDRERKEYLLSLAYLAIFVMVCAINLVLDGGL